VFEHDALGRLEAGDARSEDSLDARRQSRSFTTFLLGGDQLFEEQRVAFRGSNDPGGFDRSQLARGERVDELSRWSAEDGWFRIGAGVSYTRIIRAEILVAKRREYVEAARVAGLRDSRIIVRHLLPNVIMQAVIFAMSDIVLSLAAIVTLGYIGLGIQPPTPDWGNMIADGQNFITTKWQLSTIPGLAVVLTGLGLSLLADGVNDLMRPE